MPRLKPNERRQMANMVRKGLSKKLVAEIFGVSGSTVRKWCKRAKHRGRESFRDLPRKPRKGKITAKIEATIVALRATFGWGPVESVTKISHLNSLAIRPYRSSSARSK